MFSRSFQPSIVSLFSSTGSDPFTGLWSVERDDALPEDSFIHLINDETSLPAPPRDQNLVVPDDDANTSRQLTRLDQTVLHLQSPTLPTTFIRSPPAGSDLHLKHPWLHIQVKRLDREWSFEVGIVDHAGREGTIRCSTFKVTASLFNPWHLLIPAPPPEATFVEVILRCLTASPSPPHVPTYIVTSPNVVVQRGPERRDLHSVFFGLQPPGHSRSRMPLGTDAPCPEWHVLAHLLRQSVCHLQATQDLALRDLALRSASSLGVRALLVYLIISFIITNNFIHHTTATTSLPDVCL